MRAQIDLYISKVDTTLTNNRKLHNSDMLLTLAVHVGIGIEECCTQITEPYQVSNYYAFQPCSPCSNAAQRTPESAMPVPISNQISHQVQELWHSNV